MTDSLFDHVRRSIFGLPDGAFVRLRCRIYGHDWQACDPDCCNRWYCLRCAKLGPLLSRDVAFKAWFAQCDYCQKFRLQIFWWHACDSMCKRCRKRLDYWASIKAALRV